MIAVTLIQFCCLGIVVNGQLSNPIVRETGNPAAGNLVQLYRLVNDPVALEISAVNAENAHFTVLFGDGHGQTVCGGGTNVVDMAHTYQGIGQYSMEVFIGDESSDVTLEVQVYVLDKLPSASFYHFTDYPSELILPANATFTVERDASVSAMNFTNITCRFMDDATEKANFNLDLSHVNDDPVTITWLIDDPHVHDIGIVCENMVSTSTETVEVHVHQRLSDVKLMVINADNQQTFGSLTRYAYSVGEEVKFQVTGVGGTIGPHNYTLDFGDGEVGELSLEPHDNDSAVFSHVYSQSHYFKQSLSVNDSLGSRGIFDLHISDVADPNSGVYVYDIDMQSLRLTSTSSNTVLYEDEGAQELFEISVDPATDADRVPVEVICYWTWPGDGSLLIKDVTNFTMATMQDALVTFQYSVDEINQTLDVICQTPVGNMTLDYNLTVVKYLSDVSLSVLEGDSVQVLTLNTIYLPFLGGDFSVDITLELEGILLFTGTVPFPGGEFKYLYNFTNPGPQVIGASISDGNNEFNPEFGVDVLTKVDGLVLYINGQTAWPVVISLVEPQTTVELSISVDLYPATVLLPVQVSCLVDFDQGQSLNISVGDMAGEGLENAFNFSHTFTYVTGQALRNIQLNCSNSISNQVLTGEVLVTTVLQNVTIISDVNQVFGNRTPITVSGSGGELGINLEFVIPGEATVEYDVPFYGLFTHEHLFASPGTHDVTVNVWDATASFTLTFMFVVQKKLEPRHLVFTGLTNSISESELEQHFSLAISLDPSENWPPTNVSCEWIFPNQEETVTVSDEENLLITPSYDIAYTFDLINGNNQQMQINCSNKVSFHVENYDVWIKQLLQDFRVSVASSSVQVNLTSQTTELLFTRCDLGSNPCVLLNNNIVFNVTGSYGDFALVYDLSGLGATDVNKSVHEDFLVVGDLSRFPPGDWLATVTAVSETGMVHTATIAATLQMSVTTFDAVSIRGPTRVAIPSALPVTYTVDMPTETTTVNSVLYPPTNVSCVWGNHTGHQIGLPIPVSSITDFTEPSVSLEILLEETVTMTTSIDITCYNLVSSITKTLDIDLAPALTDLRIEFAPSVGLPQYYCAMGQSCDYDIAGRYGQLETYYEISFAEGVPTSANTVGVFENFTASHVYTEPGVYRVGISVNYSGGHQNDDCCTVYVQQALDQVTLTVDNAPGTIPDGLVEFTLTAANVLISPTNVTCEWRHPDNRNVSMDLVFESALVVNVPYTLDSATVPGHMTSSLQCSNEVSSASTQVSYLMLHKITGLEVTCGQVFAAQWENITFIVSRTGGTNVTYLLDFGVSTQLVEVGDDLSDLYVNFSYSQEGVYYVNVTATNLAEGIEVTLTPEDHVNIQKILTDLSLTDSTADTLPLLKHFPYPSGELALIVHHQPLNQPLTVYFDWDFGDDSFYFGDVPPPIWDTGYATSKTYTKEDIGQITIKVKAHNNISQQKMAVNVTLVEKVAGMTLTSQPSSTKTGEEMDFTVQVVNGSHVTYTIDYGDQTTEEVVYNYTTDVYQPEVLNRRQVFTHHYDEPGNYHVVVVGSNPESSDNVSIEHTVHYPPVPDLELVAEINPVLTPPGEMSFTVFRWDHQVFLPNNITCLWTYTDGSQNDLLTYSPGWSVDMATHFHSYTSTEQTISSLWVVVTISCSNEVTPVPKISSVNVTVEPNHVILGRFTNNGPVQPGMSITWTLDIVSYGYDPCFLWTFTNVSHSVLFGRTDCQNEPSFTGIFNEFQETQPTDDQLTYTKLFDIGPDIHVSVVAENSIGTTQSSDMALVLQEPCEAPTVTVGSEGLNMSDPRVESIADLVTISGIVETSCSYEHVYDVLWSVNVMDATGRETMSTDSLIMDKLDLTIPAHTLAVGRYRMTLRAMMRGLPVVVDSEADMYLEVVPTDLEVQISGGMERLVSGLPGYTIVMDAYSKSSDPSMGDPDNKEGMAWKWACTKTQDLSIFSIYDWSTNPDLDMGDCDLSVQVSPGILEWPSDDIVDDQYYAFAVELRKVDGRQDMFTQIISHAPFNVFDVGIDCIRNCGDLVNGRSRMRVQARCLSNICIDTKLPVYTWSFEILSELSGGFEPITVPQEELLGILDVPSDTFLEGRTYKIRLAARLDDWRGEVAMSYLVNYPPYEGNCVANITEGYVMETQFVITCSHWRDDEEENELSRRKRFLPESNAPNLLFSVFITVTNGEEVEEQLLSHSRDPVIRGTYLPLGDPSAGFVLPIYVVITDSLGSNTHVDLEIINQPRSDGDKDILLLTYLQQLKDAADAGDIQTSIQLLWTLKSLHDLDLLPTVVSPVTDEILIDLYDGPGVNKTELLHSGITEIETSGYYILQLSKLQPVSPPELQQVMKALKAVASNTSTLDPLTDTQFGIDIIDRAVSNAVVISDDMSTEELNDFLTDTVYLTGQMVDIASVYGEDLLFNSCNKTGCKDPDVLENIRENNQPLLDTAVSLLDSVVRLALRDSVYGEPPVIFDDGGKVILTAQKVAPADLAGLVIKTRLGLSRLPYEAEVFENVTAECVHAIGIAFETNPLSWHEGATEVLGPVQHVKLLDCDTKQLQPLLNVSLQNEAFQMETNFDASDEWTSTELTNTATDLAYHRFRVNDTSAHVQVFFDHHLKDVTMEMYVVFEDDPNVNHYDLMAVLPTGLPDPIPTNQEERVGVLQNLTHEGLYSYVLPRNLTNKEGVYTVGVLVKAHDDTGSPVTSVNYTFYVQFIHCRLWFDHLQRWGEHECAIEESSTPTRVKFKSKVFPSSFGAGLAVAPNTIDFGSVFEDGAAKLLANIHILVTILVFLAIYFSMLPFAVKYDREDRLNWTPLPIVGLLPSNHHYQYIVDVYTGIQSKSGTESNVYMVLIGSDAETENVQLLTTERKNFKRGSMNRFVVGSKIHLGKITYVHVYHDNSGQGDKADWFLDKVVVLDKLEQKRYLFYSNHWLSLTRENSSLRRVLRLVSKYELVDNKGMLKRRALSNVMEDNLWVSTLFRRNEDQYSRVQRLTTATALVFLSMVSSAMWYGRGDSDSPTDGIQIGPVSFTLRTVVVSIYSILTVLPGALLILLLFMKSKRRKTQSKIIQRARVVTPPPPYSETNPDVQTSGYQLKSHEDCQLDITHNNAYSASLSSVHPEIDSPRCIDQNVNNSNNSGSEQCMVKCAEEEEGRKRTDILKRAGGPFLPFWCVYVAYFLCFCAVVLSAFFTILYSFEWGSVKSAQWLGAFCLSFVESEGVISPIKAILLAVLISFFCKIPTDHSDEFYEEYKDIVFDEEPQDPNLVKGVQSLVYRRHLKAQLLKAFKALFWHTLFLVCLILVTFGNRDPNSYLCNSELRNLYYRDATNTSNQADMWDYLQYQAIPRLFLQMKYNGYAVDGVDKMYIDNALARRLGPPALRQFRVKPVSCQPVVPLEIRCSEDYKKYRNEDKKSYLPGWNIQVSNVTYNEGEQEMDILQGFVYDRGDALNYEYLGYFVGYSGRGYAQSLGSTEGIAMATLKQLIEFKWLDQHTRAVALEFNVYNPNVNLFSLVSILFEFPSVGAALVNSDISSVKLYRYIGTWGVFNLLSEAIVIIFIIVMIVRLCIHMVREGKSYFSGLWNCVEVVKLVLGLGAISMYVVRTLLIQSTVTYMMNNRDELVNFRGVTLADDIFVYLIGFMLFLQILQLAQVFKFNRSLGVFGGTLRHALSDLASFGVVIFVIFMAFLMVNYMYYGRDLWDYRNPLQGAYAQISAMLGHFRANEFEESAGFFGRITFTLFMLTMVFIYINMLVVIIMDVYADVNSGKLDIGDAHKAVDLLTETFKK